MQTHPVRDAKQSTPHKKMFLPKHGCFCQNTVVWCLVYRVCVIHAIRVIFRLQFIVNEPAVTLQSQMAWYRHTLLWGRERNVRAREVGSSPPSYRLPPPGLVWSPPQPMPHGGMKYSSNSRSRGRARGLRCTGGQRPAADRAWNCC